ncbi:MAG: hypothetical protein AB1646_18035 [Thermodesulfobacteriota bacterium]
MDYEVKVDHPWKLGHGLGKRVRVRVVPEAVHISGSTMGSWGYCLIPLPCAIFLNALAGIFVGAQLTTIPLVVICSAISLIFFFKWKSLFFASVSVGKRLITGVVRDRNKVGLCVSDPRGTTRGPVNLVLELKNEDDAVKLETELRA